MCRFGIRGKSICKFFSLKIGNTDWKKQDHDSFVIDLIPFLNKFVINILHFICSDIKL